MAIQLGSNAIGAIKYCDTAGTLHDVKNGKKSARVLSIKEIHSRGLALLKEFSSVCDRLGVDWFVACGTLLGAVRHDGFIPWDDDIDVFVHAGEQYDTISRHYTDFTSPYVFRDDRVEGDILRTVSRSSSDFIPAWRPSKYVFPKLFDTSTTGIERGRFMPGVYIDVFPYVTGDDGMVFNSIFRRESYPASWWRDFELHRFEDMYVRIPAMYEAILCKDFGDWRMPAVKRPHGSFYDVPYVDRANYDFGVL